MAEIQLTNKPHPILDTAYPIERLACAPYNPRSIPDEAFEVLKGSLTDYGVVKPVILNGSGVLTAGHQRTRALKELGMTHVPAIILDQIPIEDEIKFNLFHNAVETCQAQARVVMPMRRGEFNLVPADKIDLHYRNTKPIRVREMAYLLTLHGPWGSALADPAGNIFENGDYVQACLSMNIPVLVYSCTAEQTEGLKKIFKQDFGYYDYTKLNIKAYNQQACQPSRREGASLLWRNNVLPKVDKTTRIVDFGAGRAENAKALQAKGYKVWTYEPFPPGKEFSKISLGEVVKSITLLHLALVKEGQFDMIVLDHVLNSVSNSDYARAVLLTCNALMRDDATFMMGARTKEGVGTAENAEQLKAYYGSRRLQFYDAEHFTVSYMNDRWTLQRFQPMAEIETMLKQYFKKVHVDRSRSGHAWAECKEPIRFTREEYEWAFDMEFNFEYPSGRLDKHGPLKAALLKVLGLDK